MVVDEATAKAFRRVSAQLPRMLAAFSDEAKKSPSGRLNTFKISCVNELLQICNAILGDDYKPLSSFNLLDEDQLPSNSDVVLVLGQYAVAIERMKTENAHSIAFELYWDEGATLPVFISSRES